MCLSTFYSLLNFYILYSYGVPVSVCIVAVADPGGMGAVAPLQTYLQFMQLYNDDRLLVESAFS